MVTTDPDHLLGLEYFGRDVAAERRMALELDLLIRGQRRGLGEDGVGDPDLADVVQEPGGVQLTRPFRSPAELEREVLGQRRDAL